MIPFDLLKPLSPAADKSHHIGHPPASFHNPWPSFPSTHGGIATVLRTRFFDKRPPFVPVPSDRSELVQVQQPDFSLPSSSSSVFKVTWIGHASFLIQCCFPGQARSINILLDPVFSERTSPVTFIGPKRYTPVPCELRELLEAVPVDAICISHNHYDHADITTLREIHEHGMNHEQRPLFCVALGNARWLQPLGIAYNQIWEADWWDRIMLPLAVPLSVAAHGKPRPNSSRSSPMPESMNVPHFGVRITCTPSQHASSRGIFDRNSDLWCSWILELVTTDETPLEEHDPFANNTATGVAPTTSSVIDTDLEKSKVLRREKALFFAGDTGYRTVFAASNSKSYGNNDKNMMAGDTSQDRGERINSINSNKDNQPNQTSPCPAFSLIGQTLGPFDIALLPIGLNRPRHFMSPVHANAEDSMDIHNDIRSQRSIGMHWGTVRGGLSAHYEDVRDPPLEWEREAKLRGKKWRDRASQRTESDVDDWEIGLLDVGESLIV